MTQDTHKQGMEGRAALVTGGTSGIGLAIAQRLAQDGLRVAVLDLDRPQAREVAQAHGLTFIGADLSRRADCRRAVDETVASTLRWCSSAPEWVPCTSVLAAASSFAPG